jgi:thiol-disulfide isomerase/thioredoxin
MIEVNDYIGPAAVCRGNCILMFYTTWCPRCPPVILTLLDLEKKYKRNKIKKFTFYKIDFDHNPEAVAFFGILGVPAILSIKNGEVLEGWAGIDNLFVCREAVDRLFD